MKLIERQGDTRHQHGLWVSKSELSFAHGVLGSVGNAQPTFRNADINSMSTMIMQSIVLLINGTFI